MRRQVESRSAGGQFCQDVVFSVLRCVSPHISTRVYQSFYHLAAAVSPSGKEEAGRGPLAHKHLRGSWEVGGGGSGAERFKQIQDPSQTEKGSISADVFLQLLLCKRDAAWEGKKTKQKQNPKKLYVFYMEYFSYLEKKKTWINILLAKDNKYVKWVPGRI